jgi:hypothetical protein
LNKVERVENDLGDQLHALSRRRVVNRALKHTAPMTVSSNFNEVGSDGIVDELVVLGNELVQALLDNLSHVSSHPGL